MSQQQTLQQKRAAKAYEQVSRISSKEYGSLVRGLPAMIQGDGLGQTLAFLQAKRKPHHLDAYHHLQEWIAMQPQFSDVGSDLLVWLLKQNSDTYRQVTTEAQGYLTWLRRFVEARGLGDEVNER